MFQEDSREVDSWRPTLATRLIPGNELQLPDTLETVEVAHTATFTRVHFYRQERWTCACSPTTWITPTLHRCPSCGDERPAETVDYPFGARPNARRGAPARRVPAQVADQVEASSEAWAGRRG